MPRHLGLIPRNVRRESIKSGGLSDRALNAIAIMGAMVMWAVIFGLFSWHAHPRELGQWAQLDLEPGETIEQRAARSAWFSRQKMPDSPSQSCCGEADAYYADKAVTAPNGEDVIAIITDERPDAPLSRPHIKPGTRILVPANKFKNTSQDPNLTGHTILFVRWFDDEQTWAVYCYLPEGSF